MAWAVLMKSSSQGGLFMIPNSQHVLCVVTVALSLTSSAFAEEVEARDDTPDSSTPAPGAKEPLESEEPSETAAPRAKTSTAAARTVNTYYWVDDKTRPTLPYRDGVSVPEGYRLDSHPNLGLLVPGAVVTSTLWTVSTIAAISLDQKEPSADGDLNFGDAYWPFFIPVVGPFIAIKTADSSGTGAAILGLNGALQAAGLGMVIAGIAAPTVELIPQTPITIAPIASANTAGLEISGAF